MRYLWSIPSAVIAWFVAGFSATYLKGLPGGTTLFVPPRIDLLVLGGFAGGVLAGLLIARVRAAVPVVLVVAAGMWWLTGNSWSDRSLVITLLVASAVGAFFGALGSRSSVIAAFALALPVAWYAMRPAEQLIEWRWLWQLNGLLLAAGLALLLYAACWRRGWRSASFWLLDRGLLPVLRATAARVLALAGRRRPARDPDGGPQTPRAPAATTPAGCVRPQVQRRRTLGRPRLDRPGGAQTPAPPETRPGHLAGSSGHSTGTSCASPGCR